MLVYVSMGKRDYEVFPIPIKDAVRNVWEFLACLEGPMFLAPPAPKGDRVMWDRTLGAFPANHPHTWESHGEVERVSFHFTVVPPELTELLPHCGYYRVPLTDADCARLRALAHSARELLDKRTVKSAFLERTLAQDLSQIALREVSDRPLSTSALARVTTERAMAWFAEHMIEAPGLREVGRALSVSPTHLRRLFHKAQGKSPHAAFNRLRMQRIEDLLPDSNLTMEALAERVGLSSASALNRAVKEHFGLPPQQLRELRAAQRERK